MFNNKEDKGAAVNGSKLLAGAKLYQPGALLPLEDFDKIFTRECYRNIRQQMRRASSELSDDTYATYYHGLLARYFDYVQALPATGQRDLGSLFNQGLLRAYSMQRAVHEYYQQPQHIDEPMQPLIQYVAFSAGLLLQLYEVYTSYQVLFCHPKRGEFKGLWNPMLGNMYQQGNGFYYKFYACSRPVQAVHEEINVMLAQQVMPDLGMAWIAGQPKLLQQWINMLKGSSDVWGPFAYALQHYQRFMHGAEFAADWIEEFEFVAELEAGEAFMEWLQQLQAEDLQRLAAHIKETKLGVALDLKNLAQHFSQTPEGRKLMQAQGGLVARHAGVEIAFREAFPLGLDAQLQAARQQTSQGGFSMGSAAHTATQVYIVPAELLRGRATAVDSHTSVNVAAGNRVAAPPKQSTATVSSASVATTTSANTDSSISIRMAPTSRL